MEEKNSDEINLYDLWKIIAKRKKFIIALFFIAVISTAVVSVLMPKIYRGEALLNILQYEEIPTKNEVRTKAIVQPKEIVDMIGIVDQEKKAKIFPATYRSVTDLKLKPIKDSKDKLLVTIEAKNADQIGKALSEVVDYINNFEIVKMIVKEEKEKLLKRSSELSDVIDSSANLSITFRKLLNEGKLHTIGFNPIDLNKRIMDIKLEKLMVDQGLQRLNGGGIEMAKQLYIRNKPVGPKTLSNIIIAGIISFFIGVFLVAFLEYMDKIKK